MLSHMTATALGVWGCTRFSPVRGLRLYVAERDVRVLYPGCTRFSPVRGLRLQGGEVELKPILVPLHEV